jgi:Cu(I)/Ag(I) efflux system membrane protein CusA/SilA
MVMEALQKANQAAGGSVVELAEAEYMVRSRGFLQSLDDFRGIPVALSGATPVLLRDVAIVQVGPEMRRGIAELDGKAKSPAGVVVMRSGKNARTTIAAVKARLESLKASLPPGVEVVTTYDRSLLIDRAVDNLRWKLLEEFTWWRWCAPPSSFTLRSAFVAVVTLPVGVLAAFVVMHWQGVSANILSLGGIAIACGAMVDAAIVLIENAHKHLEAFERARPRRPSPNAGSSSRTPRSKWARRCSSRCWSSRCRSCRCSRWRRRRAGCSRRWRSPRPTRWPRPRPVGDAGAGADGLPRARPHPAGTPTRSTAA